MMCACGHPDAVHLAHGPCRMGGCPCERFTDRAAKPDAQDGPQRVSIDVPAGYTLHVVLVPPGGAIEGVELPEESSDA